MTVFPSLMCVFLIIILRRGKANMVQKVSDGLEKIVPWNSLKYNEIGQIGPIQKREGWAPSGWGWGCHEVHKESDGNFGKAVLLLSVLLPLLLLFLLFVPIPVGTGRGEQQSNMNLQGKVLQLMGRIPTDLNPIFPGLIDPNKKSSKVTG